MLSRGEGAADAVPPATGAWGASVLAAAAAAITRDISPPAPGPPVRCACVGGEGCKGGFVWPGVGGLGRPTGVRPPAAEYGWKALPPAPGTGLASGCCAPGVGLQVVRGSGGKNPATDVRGGAPGAQGVCCCCCWVLRCPSPPSSLAINAEGVGDAAPAAAVAPTAPPSLLLLGGLTGRRPPPPGDSSLLLPPGCMGGRPSPADPLSRNSFMAGTKEVL